MVPLLACVVAGCARSDAGPASRMLGAHALVGQEDAVAEPVVRTPPLATAAHGSTLVAFLGGFASNAATPTDTYGNRWRALGAPAVYRGYDGRFDLRVFVAADARGGPAQVVRVAKPGEPAGESTLAVVEVRDAGRLLAASSAYPQAGFHLASATVRTDGPALLVAAWWGDAHGLRHVAEPGDGFEVIERFTRLPPNSAVQGVVAVRAVDRAGSYRVDWYNAPRQGAILSLLAFARK